MWLSVDVKDLFNACYISKVIKVIQESLLLYTRYLITYQGFQVRSILMQVLRKKIKNVSFSIHLY